MTALVQITPQHLDLAGQEICLRAAHDDDRSVCGDILLLCEHQLLGPIVVPAERRGNSAVAFAFRRDRIFLAVTLHEIDLLLLTGHGLDERVRQVLLGIGGRTLTAVLVFDDHRAIALNVVLARLHRLGVRIDVLHGNLVRVVVVLVETAPEAVELRRFIEDEKLDRRVQIAQKLHRLLGEAVLFVRGQVPALVLTRREIVDGDDDAQPGEHTRRRERAVARLPVVEDRDDVAPLAERVQHHARQASPGRVHGVLVPLRPEEAHGDRRKHERGSDPPDDPENPFQHGSFTSTNEAMTIANHR